MLQRRCWVVDIGAQITADNECQSITQIAIFNKIKISYQSRHVKMVYVLGGTVVEQRSMAGKHGKAKQRMQNMVSADALVLLPSQKVILICLSSRWMIFVTGGWWSKPLIEGLGKMLIVYNFVFSITLCH